MLMYFVLMIVYWFLNFFVVSITAQPLNEAWTIPLGVNKIITCNGSTVSPRWDFYEPGSKDTSSKHIFHDGHQLNPKFSNSSYAVRVKNVSNNLFESELSLLRVGTRHAGTYSCHDGYKSRTLMLVDIGILASGPTCSVSDIGYNITERDDSHTQSLKTRCEVNFTGNWLPVFTCQPQTLQPEYFNATVEHQYHVTYTHTIEVSTGKGRPSVFCELHFKPINILVKGLISPAQWNWSYEYDNQISTVSEDSASLLQQHFTVNTPSVADDTQQENVSRGISAADNITIILTIAIACAAVFAVISIAVIVLKYKQRHAFSAGADIAKSQVDASLEASSQYEKLSYRPTLVEDPYSELHTDRSSHEEEAIYVNIKHPSVALTTR